MLNAPQNLYVTSFDGSVRSTWKAVDGADGYILKFYNKDEPDKCIKSRYAQGTTKLILGFKNGREYLVSVLIKASIEAAFDMEAAIPQIIESAIYACYEDYGWNISTNRNELYENPFEDGIYAFPTLQDLINKVPEIVDEQGFDNRLKSDYIGSIRARLMGLMMGTKGMMLNTKRSIDFRDLLDKKVVLELEEVRSGSEKSLIMGFVLTNLMQAIKGRFLENEGRQHKHVTLVEEAHRLLSKFVAGDSPNKKQGVETFTDMLAEIRKYGECLVIVDQIPNKLTPEILKNTNTKIVHKLFAEDDKDAIGNTIVLDKEQKEFLSNLDTGRAIVFSQGYSKAIQVQIKRVTETDAETQIKDYELREAVYQYYCDNYKKGIIANSQFCECKPNYQKMEWLLELSKDRELSRLVYKYGTQYGKLPDDDMIKNIQDALSDELLCEALDEISKAKNDSEKKGPIIVQKQEMVDILKKYIAQFGKEFLVDVLLDSYYESKHVKKKRRGKELRTKEGFALLVAYITKYVDMSSISLAEVRNIRDKL